jgi:hypothetical protein
MKYFIYSLLVLAFTACNKDELDTVTINLTNETPVNIFGVSGDYDESIYGDIPVDAMSSFVYPAEQEFPFGEPFPSQQTGTLASGAELTIVSNVFCGNGYYEETAAPGVYNVSIQYVPADTLIFDGQAYPQPPFYMMVPKG